MDCVTETRLGFGPVLPLETASELLWLLVLLVFSSAAHVPRALRETLACTIRALRRHLLAEPT